MDAETIQAIATDLRIRERTAELCTLMGINPLTHREQCQALMETLLDVAIEGWLSAKALGR